LPGYFQNALARRFVDAAAPVQGTVDSAPGDPGNLRDEMNAMPFFFHARNVKYVNTETGCGCRDRARRCLSVFKGD
jgi:hypothetical protein